jgi:hypothetical protein
MATPYAHSSYSSSTVYPPTVGDAWRGADSRGDKDRGRLARTPSPDPEEAAALAHPGLVDWRGMSRPSYWLRKSWISACPDNLSLSGRADKQHRILYRLCAQRRYRRARRPLPQTDRRLPETCNTISSRVRTVDLSATIRRLIRACFRTKYGFLIPIAILFVISFPPVRPVPHTTVPKVSSSLLSLAALRTRNRSRALWPRVGPRLGLCDRRRRHVRRRDRQLLVSTPGAGTGGAGANGTTARSNTAVRRAARSWRRQIFNTRVLRRSFVRAVCGSRSLLASAPSRATVRCSWPRVRTRR